MKAILLAAGLLLAPPIAFGQKAPAVGFESSVPFKGANAIVVHAPDSASTALKKMARALIEAGIEPDKIETEVGYLTTKGKPVGQLSPATYQYKIVSTPDAGGTALVITGTYTVKLNLVNSMTNPMYWVKGNMLQAKQCFITIQPVAEAYPGGRVTYMQKKP